MKILITGPTRAGKSTLIHALTNGKSISIDKHGTTVALDHGVISVKDIKFYLFGTPGLEHFSILRKILSEGADGIIFVVDSSNRKNDGLAKIIWREIASIAPSVPCIVAANKQDVANARKPRELRKEMPFLVGVPIIPISAKEKYNTDVLMNSLLMIILIELSPLLKTFQKFDSVKNGINLLINDLKLEESKVKSYLNWMEYRDLIEVDWDARSFYLKEGLKNILNSNDISSDILY